MNSEIWDLASDLIEEGEFESAQAILAPLAESGSPDAQYLLGTFPMMGDDKMSGEEARRWLGLSAAQDYPPALYELCRSFIGKAGTLHWGGPRDEEGRSQLRRAAELGFAPAQTSLAAFLCTGDSGFVKDECEGRQWYAAAVEQGFTDACYDYAFMLLEGEGGDPDPKKAIKILRAAAEESNLDCIDFLVEIYSDGLFGVRRNRKLAKKYLALSEEIWREIKAGLNNEDFLEMTEALNDLAMGLEAIVGPELSDKILTTLLEAQEDDKEIDRELESKFGAVFANLPPDDLLAIMEKIIAFARRLE